MAQHEQVAIAFPDLYGLVFDGSDGPWREVIGINCAPLDALDELQENFVRAGRGEMDITEAEERVLDAAWNAGEKALREALADTWWIVSWPEHVLNPRYDSDAYYSDPMSKADACKLADVVYEV